MVRPDGGPPPSPSRAISVRAAAQGRTARWGEINHDGKRTLIVMGRPVPRSHRRVTGNGPPYPPSLIDAPISVTRNGPPPSHPLGKILMKPDSAQKSRPIDPVFRADSVVLAISAEKDGNLRVVYARIGRCQGRPAWRGAQAAVARPYPAVTCHVVVNGGPYVFEPPAGGHRYMSRGALPRTMRTRRGLGALHE